MAYLGFVGAGHTGNFPSTGVLEATYPAQRNAGRKATVETGGVVAWYFSNGSSWVPISALVPGFDLIPLIGQSNEAGRGVYDSNIDTTNANVYQYGGYSADGSTYQLVVPAIDRLRHPELGVQQPGVTLVGPGMFLGKAYTALSSKKTLLVPLSWGGIDLVGGAWAATTGARYTFMVSQTNAALTAANAIQSGGAIPAAAFLQGEADGSYGVPGAVYGRYLTTLIVAARANITGATNMAFVIGQMMPEAITANVADNATYTPTYPAIDAAHTLIAAGTPKATKVAIGTGFNSGDNLHYNAAGARLMGTAQANGIATAVANTGDTVAPGQVTGLTLGAATSDTQALSWTAPAGTVRWYEVEFSIASSGAWRVFRGGSYTTATSITVTGLDNSINYDYRVRAANVFGAGTYSSTATGSTSAGANSTSLRFSLFTNCVEDGTGPFQYWETANAVGYVTSRVGGASKKFQALAASHSATCSVKNLIGTMFGVVTSAGTNPIWNTASTGYLYGIYANSSSYGIVLNQATTVGNGTAVVPANGDIMQIRRTDNGTTSTVFLEVARAATPSTFVTVHTETTASRADLWPCVTLQGGRGSIINHTGLV